MGFHGRNRSVRDDRRKGIGFISHHEIEWGLFGDGVGAVIMNKFCIGD